MFQNLAIEQFILSFLIMHLNKIIELFSYNRLSIIFRSKLSIVLNMFWRYLEKEFPSWNILEQMNRISLAIWARRCLLTPTRRWSHTIDQMTTLPTRKSSRPLRLLTFLAWQSTTYWIWNGINARLHSNTFWSIDTLLRFIDLQIWSKTQSFRESNPRLSSAMLQS